MQIVLLQRVRREIVVSFEAEILHDLFRFGLFDIVLGYGDEIEFGLIAYIEFGYLVVLTGNHDQLVHAGHVQFGQLIRIAFDVVEFMVFGYIDRREFILANSY